MRVWFRRYLFAVPLMLSADLYAATFTVNTTTDSVDANPGDGSALDGSGFTSLRAAIMEANALGGDDIITLPAGTYALSLAGGDENAAATGDLDIDSTITINGAAAAMTIIDANDIDRVLHVLPARTLNLNNVTVRDGLAPNEQDFGGGIFNDGGTLDVQLCVIRENEAFNGAGIANTADPFQTTTLEVSQSTITLNVAASDGGGIYNSGIFGFIGDATATVTVTGSTISQNSAVEIGTAICNNAEEAGTASVTIIDSTINANNSLTDTATGALWNLASFAADANLTVTRSTISNHTSQFIGAIFSTAFDATATLLVTNSTISGNQGSDYTSNLSSAISNVADFHGGSNAIATVRNSTITNNTTVLIFPQGGPGEGGAAFRNQAYAGTATFTLTNTIVAGNLFSGAGPDIAGGFVGNGNNLIGNTTGGTGFSGSDLLNVNPLLAALANNGGPTLTHAIPSNSPARNAGNNTGAPATDQRGLTRIVGGTIDIGAFELQATLNDVYVNFAFVGSEQGTQSNPFNTLAEALAAAASSADIHITGGTTSEEPIINQPVRLLSTGGLVRIGVIGGRSTAPKSVTGFVAPE